MLQPMGSQRVGHDLAIEQQRQVRRLFAENQDTSQFFTPGRIHSLFLNVIFNFNIFYYCGKMHHTIIAYKIYLRYIKYIIKFSTETIFNYNSAALTFTLLCNLPHHLSP